LTGKFLIAFKLIEHRIILKSCNAFEKKIPNIIHTKLGAYISMHSIFELLLLKKYTWTAIQYGQGMTV
jgi:hypothetical protein